MARSVAALFLALLCAAPAAAQDRLIQLGWLWELSGTDLTRLRPVPPLPGYPDAVVVAGSRYVVAPVYLGPGTAALGFLDVVAGTQGLVPGVPLEVAENPNFYFLPVLAQDPRRPRVFVWHRTRISEVDASLGLRDVITGLPEPSSYLASPLLAYSPAADALAFALPSEMHNSEVIIARATTGEELRRILFGGTVLQLAADPLGSRLIVTVQPPLAPGVLNKTVHVFDLTDGTLTTLPYAPLIFVAGPVIDSTNHRLLFSWTGGVLATDDHGVVLGELNTGSGGRQITWVAGVSAATGRTFVQSNFGGGTYIPPGPCLLHVVERMGQPLAPIDLSARLGRQEGRCDPGILLTAPGAPGTPSAAVAGASVALSWEHPGNVERFELEAQAAGATRLFDLGLEPSFAIGGVPTGTYRVRVRGHNAIGVGPWSGVAEVVVPPAGSGQLPTVRAIVQ